MIGEDGKKAQPVHEPSGDEGEPGQALSKNLDTSKPLVRVFLGALFLIMAPLGLGVLYSAFDQAQPHIFVMLIFSGSLSLLVGLCGLVGFAASFRHKGASRDKTPPDAE